MQQDPTQPLLNANNTANLILRFTVMIDSCASKNEELTARAVLLAWQENAASCLYSRKQSFVVTAQGTAQEEEEVKERLQTL